MISISVKQGQPDTHIVSSVLFHNYHVLVFMYSLDMFSPFQEQITKQKKNLYIILRPNLEKRKKPNLFSISRLRLRIFPITSKQNNLILIFILPNLPCINNNNHKSKPGVE